MKFGLEKLEALQYCVVRFDILNRLSVVNECDGQTDGGRTDARC